MKETELLDKYHSKRQELVAAFWSEASMGLCANTAFMHGVNVHLKLMDITMNSLLRMAMVENKPKSKKRRK